MQEKIQADLKQAMLSGDKARAETLRGLKSALQYEAVGASKKPDQLTEEEVQKVLAREAKKRAEAAELYNKAGEAGRADAELAEKAVIDTFLPEQLSEDEIAKAVDEELSKLDNPQPSDMGKVIGAVRGRLGAAADGATIARLVKEKLQS